MADSTSLQGPLPKLRDLSFTQVLFAAALLILAVQIGSALYLFVHHAIRAVPFPYPLEYGEGPILDQVLRLTRFENIYRTDLAQPPYTISNHPPLFHLFQLPFAWIAGPAFWYGRILSLLSAILAAIFIGLTVHHLTGDTIAAAVAGLLLLTFPYLLRWSALDYIDTMALALSWAALYAILRWSDERRGLALAIVLFAAALLTKPSYALVGPGTALIWLLHGRRFRQALQFAGWLGGVCLALFLLLHIMTGGGFFFNLVTANAANAVSHIGFMANVTGLFINAWILVLSAIGFLVVERWWYPTRSWPLVLPYVLLSTGSLLLVGRAGAGENDLLEPAAALCLSAGAVLAWARRNYLLKTAAVLILALQVNGLVQWSRLDYLPVFNSKVNAAGEIAQLAEIVREAPRPVLSDEYMGLSPLAGQPVYFQPFEFYQFEAANLWDSDDLVAAVEQQAFSAILLYEPSTGSPMIVSRWSPQLRAAIWENYQAVSRLASTWVYLPKDAAP